MRTLPRTSVDAKAVSGHGTTSVTITNRSDKVAFFLRADIRRAHWVTWDDNDLTLWPGESQVVTATYDPAELHGAKPVVTLSGFNTDTVTVE